MRCGLTDQEDAAPARLLSDAINDDRYLLLARIRLLKGILGRIGRSGHLHHCRADPPQGNPWGLDVG
jgi:hypothetical protein